MPGMAAAGQGNVGLSCVVPVGAPGERCRRALPQHLQPPRLSRKPGILLSDAGTARRIRSLPAGHVSGHQSDVTGEQQLEPRHSDNFIRSNPSLLRFLGILLLLLEAVGLKQEVSH